MRTVYEGSNGNVVIQVTRLGGFSVRVGDGHHNSHGAAHSKLSASLVSPVPLYLATFGYAHSGLVIAAFIFPSAPAAYFVAKTFSTGAPFSTQSCKESNRPNCGPLVVLAPNCPNALGPGPPEQCSIPGAM